MNPNSLKALAENRAKGWFGTGKHKKCTACNRPAVKGYKGCRWHGGRRKKPKTDYVVGRRAIYDKRRIVEDEIKDYKLFKVIDSPHRAIFGDDVLLCRAAAHAHATIDDYGDLKARIEYLKTLRRPRDLKGGQDG